LRFPEFADEWKQTTLGEILAIGNGKDYKHLSKGNIPVFGTGGYMTSVNQFLMDGESVFIGRKGTIDKPFYYNGKFWTVDTLFYTHSFVNSSPRFVLYLFSNINWLEYNEASGVPSLSKTTISKIQIFSPQIAEQQKIASFLSLIDERIESCSEIIKEIKAQKSCLRTLILNMIIVRWIKLKQAVEQGIINLKRGEVIPKQSQSSENIYPVYSSSVQNKGLMGFHNSYMFDKELISWSIDGGGHLFYRPRHKFNVTNVCGVLETSCFDYVFLCEVLKEQHRKLLFDYQNKAHPSVIQELYQVPMLEISEQRYYGKLFRLLNERIEVEEELLEQYERQKRYLLRQMFV